MSGAEPGSRPKPAGDAQRAAPRRRRAPDYHFTAAGFVLNSQKPCIHFGEEPIFKTYWNLPMRSADKLVVEVMLSLSKSHTIASGWSSVRLLKPSISIKRMHFADGAWFWIIWRVISRSRAPIAMERLPVDNSFDKCILDCDSSYRINTSGSTWSSCPGWPVKEIRL